MEELNKRRRIFSSLSKLGCGPLAPYKKKKTFNSREINPHLTYRKIPKISPEAYIFQRPFMRGLYTEGNLRFKIG